MRNCPWMIAQLRSAITMIFTQGSGVPSFCGFVMTYYHVQRIFHLTQSGVINWGMKISLENIIIRLSTEQSLGHGHI